MELIGAGCLPTITCQEACAGQTANWQSQNPDEGDEACQLHFYTSRCGIGLDRARMPTKNHFHPAPANVPRQE